MYLALSSLFHRASCLSFSHRYSALIKAIHHIDHQPLASKAKTTCSSLGDRSPARSKEQQRAGGPIIRLNGLSGRGRKARGQQ